jgi:periplasmic divalent cation tolerance protein
MKKVENFVILLCNTPNIENAKQIANTLVKEKLIVCANIFSGVISIYEWEGEILEEGEVTILIKSHRALLDEIESRILELHPYETPEIIQIDIENSNEDYYNWLLRTLGK